MRKKTNIFVNIVDFIYEWRVSIESLIDSGTWSPTDENMVSIDMRFLDPHRRF
jgi:hypothetical protein